MRTHGKRYRASVEGVNLKEVLPLADAVAKLKSYKAPKFDQSVDIVMHLGIDPKQADQAVRGSIALPHGIGKSKRVVAFCRDDVTESAKAAGAVDAGGETLVKRIEEGWMDFDVAVASPDMMRVVSRLGKVLGPKGLMPSPKSGTVTPDVLTAVKEYSAGKVEFRNDTFGNVHAVIGKFSFPADKLRDNAQAFIDAITRMRPASTKGVYIKKIGISGSMTPGVLVQIASAAATE